MRISTPRDWGNVVRDRRVELNMTQEQLADHVGKARQWVVRFESGNAGSASIASLTKLLDVLDLAVDVAEHDEDPDPMFMDLTIQDPWEK